MPITRDDQRINYVPTQIISEYIKSIGYDGIIYKSSVGTGNNLALFDISLATPVRAVLVKITKVQYKSEIIEDQYSSINYK